MAKKSSPSPGRFPSRPVAVTEGTRGDRLTLRMHPDIMEILALRASERGVSRSHLVEQILVGFMRCDPRNPRMEPMGRIAADAESPLNLLEHAPEQLAEKWQKFTTAHTLVLGSPPPSDWLEDPRGYWDGIAYEDRSPVGKDVEEASLERVEKAQRGRSAHRRPRQT